MLLRLGCEWYDGDVAAVAARIEHPEVAVGPADELDGRRVGRVVLEAWRYLR